MVFQKVKIFSAALALCFSANISHAQTPGLAGLLIQFNQLSGSLPAIPGLDSLLGTGAAANSQLLQAIIPLSNNVPVLGTVVGGVVPIGTQLAAVGLPLLLNPPSDLSGIQALLTTDLTSLLDLSSLLPGASTDFLVLPALPIIPDLVELQSGPKDVNVLGRQLPCLPIATEIIKESRCGTWRNQYLATSNHPGDCRHAIWHQKARQHWQ